jgi:hypothetical protein
MFSRGNKYRNNTNSSARPKISYSQGRNPYGAPRHQSQPSAKSGGGPSQKCFVLILLAVCGALGFVLFGDFPGSSYNVVVLDNERFNYLLETSAPKTKQNTQSFSMSSQEQQRRQREKEHEHTERVEFKPDIDLTEEEQNVEAQEEADQEEKYRHLSNQHFEEVGGQPLQEDTQAPNDQDHGQDD